ncbi:BZ3500_MvSof-1268-A1-R1_Chr3-1g05883 [Microbotryum saponariae]|uniref:BZ3500_MvSof-1268-A1-R1_Chr3-1g05883 protein n=1 Tax=Microbotryum saponariae TaxID=289078 RepID=A0A2X0LZU1_9BASI|nr:BZ3500_MvSof-1268-A1-R1_Chr3-1g05883 [Microbotryum saponariae]SDA05073.1 BZ3501_MvSof-1269-A2-R1_Chr3-1g05553 [Microbotryum saponariae]
MLSRSNLPSYTCPRPLFKLQDFLSQLSFQTTPSDRDIAFAVVSHPYLLDHKNHALALATLAHARLLQLGVADNTIDLRKLKGAVSKARSEPGKHAKDAVATSKHPHTAAIEWYRKSQCPVGMGTPTQVFVVYFRLLMTIAVGKAEEQTVSDAYGAWVETKSEAVVEQYAKMVAESHGSRKPRFEEVVAGLLPGELIRHDDTESLVTTVGQLDPGVWPLQRAIDDIAHSDGAIHVAGIDK